MLKESEHGQQVQAEQGLEKVINKVVKQLDRIFLGQYLQNKIKLANRVIFVDWYVTAKTILPLILLMFGVYHVKLIWILTLYLTLETINYNCFHIFQAKNFKTPKSLARNVLLGFFNYVEIILNFAFLYASSGCIRRTTVLEAKRAINFLDYIYFSVVTGTTVGFGDLIVVGNIGHLLVIFQVLILIIFITIFISYNLSLFINNAAK